MDVWVRVTWGGCVEGVQGVTSMGARMDGLPAPGTGPSESEHRPAPHSVYTRLARGRGNTQEKGNIMSGLSRARGLGGKDPSWTALIKEGPWVPLRESHGQENSGM